MQSGFVDAIPKAEAAWVIPTREVNVHTGDLQNSVFRKLRIGHQPGFVKISLLRKQISFLRQIQKAGLDIRWNFYISADTLAVVKLARPHEPFFFLLRNHINLVLHTIPLDDDIRLDGVALTFQQFRNKSSERKSRRAQGVDGLLQLGPGREYFFRS